MKNDSLELAENKLLLLYIINEINLPLSNLQLTDIVLENDFIDYFNFQQYLLELSSSNLIRYFEGENKISLAITDKGREVLSMFYSRLTSEKIDRISNYLEKNIDSIRKEISLKAEYQLIKDKGYVVELGVYENRNATLELKIAVANPETAREICANFKNSYDTMKDTIYNLLLNKQNS